MYARVTVVQGDPDRIDVGKKSFEENVLPAVQAVQGYKGSMLMVDRSSGKGIGMTLWETEKDSRAGGKAVAQARKMTIEEMGGTVPPVDEYEVMVSDFR
jgi:hypothetical protein